MQTIADFTATLPNGQSVNLADKAGIMARLYGKTGLGEKSGL